MDLYGNTLSAPVRSVRGIGCYLLQYKLLYPFDPREMTTLASLVSKGEVYILLYSPVSKGEVTCISCHLLIESEGVFLNSSGNHLGKCVRTQQNCKCMLVGLPGA